MRLALLLAVGVRPALAQEPLVRADVSGTLGWFNTAHVDLNRNDHWDNDSLLGELGSGWYWTDHWKTEIMAGASTETDVYTSVAIGQGGQPLSAPSRIRFSTRRLSVTQQYQFGDNQWVHAYLGAGIDAVWERSSRRDEAVYAYDSVTRQYRLIRGVIEHPRETDMRALAAACTGFKAYLTRQGFFRSDLRVTFADGVEEAVLRFGFGIDF